MLNALQSGPFPALLWQGNDGFIIADGQRMIATDLDLTLEERLLPPTVQPEELAGRLDWLMITHGHEDHFSTAAVSHLLKGNRCRFVIPESCREKATAIPGLADRAVFARPGDTLLLEEHLDMHGVDVLFVSPTEHNLGVENAVRLIRMLRPQKIILQHHSTYREHAENLFWAHGYVTELLEALSGEERERCIVPEQNRIIRL